MNHAWVRSFLILRGNYVETRKTNNRQQSDFLHIFPLYIEYRNESPPFSLTFIRQKERRGGRSNDLDAFQTVVGCRRTCAFLDFQICAMGLLEGVDLIVAKGLVPGVDHVGRELTRLYSSTGKTVIWE